MERIQNISPVSKTSTEVSLLMAKYISDLDKLREYEMIIHQCEDKIVFNQEKKNMYELRVEELKVKLEEDRTNLQ